jgi:hypothetical protein
MREKGEIEDGFMHLFTSASLGHKHARAYIAFYYENGMYPNKVRLESLLGPGNKFEFLAYLSDIRSLIKPDNYSLKEFK